MRLMTLVLFCVVTPCIAAPPAQHTVSAPGLLADAARLLSETSWNIVIEATVQADGEGTAGWMDELTVWYDPAGVVRLRLGRLSIEARPGRLVAFHEWNSGAYYRADHPGAGIAEVLRAELPPLWCPWLAIALSGGDPCVWPVVGLGGLHSIEYDRKPLVSSTPGPYALDKYRGRWSGGGVDVAVVSALPGSEAEERSPAIVAFSYRLSEGGDATTMLHFEVQRDERREWIAPEVGSRKRVSSIAGLSPPPPELGFGDRFPAISLTRSGPDAVSIGLWRPLEVFKNRQDLGSRYTPVLVLALTRPNDNASAWLGRTSEMIGKARALMTLEDDSVRVLACPVISTTSTKVVLDQLRLLRRAWVEQGEDGRESLVPEITWCPAPLLLDRFAPGADAAIVVIDRTGWIVGVHGEDATLEDIVESIKAAAR